MVIYSWITYEKWWFSIVMLVYQRVSIISGSSWCFEYMNWWCLSDFQASMVPHTKITRGFTGPLLRLPLSWGNRCHDIIEVGVLAVDLNIHKLLLVGGLEHFLFSIIYRIIMDNPSHWLIFFYIFQRGGSTTNQYLCVDVSETLHEIIFEDHFVLPCQSILFQTNSAKSRSFQRSIK